MSDSPPRTWSLDEMIDRMQSKGCIKTPFTPDERALARAAAEAYHFAFYLVKLPARSPDVASKEFISYWWGISQVRIKRVDLPNDGRKRIGAI
jgi:hypothetical protein